MAMTPEQLAKQKKQAEALLFSGPDRLGFAKALFYGRFNGDLLFPYPELAPETKAVVDEAVAKVRKFADEKIDPDAIDRNADIPQDVIDGLAELGVLGMTAPEEFGGRGFDQQGYCQIMEVIGARCASTAVFVNAHHSIGVRALLIYGTDEQKKTWLPDLINGKKLAAFALTEPEAGSDAAGVQTVAVPTDGGEAFLLSGTKHYITNGGIADVLTLMARTPAPTPDDPDNTEVTAFLVTPDMPGFEVIEERAEKCGIRGTATGKMRLTDVRVPKANILGKPNKGLSLALNVLNFGRTTFGATCTGVAKYCVEMAAKHAKARKQFKQSLSDFELVKKKIAFMAAHAFAMEAATQQCAAFIDRGATDYRLETAILKVFATEHLWAIVNETIQVYGGKAYFCDQPFERMMRDARINMIGEGANEVLKSFITAFGSRGPGMQLDAIRRRLKSNPFVGVYKGVKWSVGEAGRRLGLPTVPAQHESLAAEAKQLARFVRRLYRTLIGVFRRAGTEERFIQAQYQHERLADVAIDLYAASCALSRLDHLLSKTDANGEGARRRADIEAGRHFMKLAFGRIGRNLDDLWSRDVIDASTTQTADAVLTAVNASSS